MKIVQNIFSIKINIAIHIEDESYECEKCVSRSILFCKKNYAQNVLNLYILHQFENMFFPWKMNAIFAFQPFGKKQILWIFDVIFQKFEIPL